MRTNIDINRFKTVVMSNVCTACFNVEELNVAAHVLYLCASYDFQNKQRLFFLNCISRLAL
jgi:hypothetical protein